MLPLGGIRFQPGNLHCTKNNPQGQTGYIILQRYKQPRFCAVPLQKVCVCVCVCTKWLFSAFLPRLPFNSEREEGWLQYGFFSKTRTSTGPNASRCSHQRKLRCSLPRWTSKRKGSETDRQRQAREKVWRMLETRSCHTTEHMPASSVHICRVDLKLK